MAKRSLKFAQALGSESTDKRLDILRRIGELGSISEAARQAGVSYKGAWQAIDTLGNLAGLPLLERNVGGSGGGGAQLTDAGRELIAAADQLSAAKTRVLSELQAGKSTARLSPAKLGALSLRTSMRNQFPCAVAALKKAGGATQVTLHLAGAAPLVSRITIESAELLALQPGKPVLALFKATAVQIAKTMEAVAGRNVLQGVVTRASRAAAGGEVALQLDGGLQVVGFGAPNSGLKVRDVAYACFEESAVVIALA